MLFALVSNLKLYLEDHQRIMGVEGERFMLSFYDY